MCMGGASIPSPPPPPPPPPPSPELPTPAVTAAGTTARARAAAAMGPMAQILNAGGAPGLATPASTTAASQLGQ